MEEAILDCQKKVPIRIWVSLEGLVPEDIIVGNDGSLELVISITPNELTTISKINKADISRNLRPLMDYAPMRMKPDKTIFYSNAYNSTKRAAYEIYNSKLIRAGI